jgi:aspartate-semialdehyde dehydrogenase
MLRVGFVGWRGMVGSVLMDRMQAENDFQGFEPFFFSTSQVGQPGPALGLDAPPVMDANDLAALRPLDVIVTCQGGDYTKAVHPKLRSAGWTGYWIDAASALRMASGSTIVLDPVNRPVIDRALAEGKTDFIGGNCTVSLMLMAINALFREGLVSWVSSMTYQAASGAGAKNMRELMAQTRHLGEAAAPLLDGPAGAILELDRRVLSALQDPDHPTANFGAPLAGSLIPWIDSPMENGQTREEWKGAAETNKILGCDPPVPVDGICVRVSVMRCHSQGLTIRLTREVPLADIEALIAGGNDWVRVVPNEKAATLRELSPAAVTGTLTVPVGRIRKMNLGPEYQALFTVGDQLLWGAAEPIRRIFNIIRTHLGR